MKVLVRKETIEYLEVEVPDGSGRDEILEVAYKTDTYDWEVDHIYYEILD
jgi:hypothetical protein